MDMELIKQCADDRLQPAIVERFIEAVGAASSLAVSVTIDGKAVLLPRISSAREAADVVAQHAGYADVRFGLTRYPAGIGDATASDIDETLFDPCRNLAIGTELFAGIYEAVAADTESGSTAHFEKAVGVYLAGERGPVRDEALKAAGPERVSSPKAVESADPKSTDDPFKAGIRVEVPTNMD